MTAPPFIPDVASPRAHGGAPQQSEAPQAGEFGKVLDDLGSALGKANSAEDAFANGAGDLQSAIYERARADVALAVATAASQRAAQALQAIFSMQV
jgi:flagellar hook-basal body complex protein FliE